MVEATRSGLVEEFTRPEKGPVRCKVGGKVVKAWPTVRGSDGDEANPAVAVLEAGGHVEVTGYEKSESYNGKNWTAFYATWAGPISAPNGNGSQPTFTGRDPGKADRWQAARWAISCAVEALGPGQEIAKYVDTGSQFFQGSIQLAEAEKTSDEW